MLLGVLFTDVLTAGGSLTISANNFLPRKWRGWGTSLAWSALPCLFPMLLSHPIGEQLRTRRATGTRNTS